MGNIQGQVAPLELTALTDTYENGTWFAIAQPELILTASQYVEPPLLLTCLTLL